MYQMYVPDDILVKTEIEDALRAYLDSQEASDYIRIQHECMRKAMENYMSIKFTSDAEEAKKKAQDYTMEKLCARITELLQEKSAVDSGFTSRLLIYHKYRENSEKKMNLIQYLFSSARKAALEFLEDFSKKYCKEMDKSDIDTCALYMSYCISMKIPRKEGDAEKINNAVIMAAMFENSSDIFSIMVMSALTRNN